MAIDPMSLFPTTKLNAEVNQTKLNNEMYPAYYQLPKNRNQNRSIVATPAQRPIRLRLPYFKSAQLALSSFISSPHLTNLIFAGGSIDGIYSRTAYPIPTSPTSAPSAFFHHEPPTMIDPMKM